MLLAEKRQFSTVVLDLLRQEWRRNRSKQRELCEPLRLHALNQPDAEFNYVKDLLHRVNRRYLRLKATQGLAKQP